jgi:D-alanyl-D-alanine carboxypeptidase
MLRTRWFRATAAAAVVTAIVFTGGTAWSDDGRGTGRRYGQAQLQRDLDAIRAIGVSGVLAEVNVAGRRLRGTSGVADFDAGGAIDVDSNFRMGSNTKTFVAVVVLQLVGERRISLDDTVERWLPGVVRGNGNDGSAITVRQLLQHTSGLYDYTDDLLARVTSPEAYQVLRYESFTPVQLVAMALAHEPYFAPGAGWNYSNTNYVLIGQIIQKVTGRTWDREVRDRILRPLGLRHTFAPGHSTDLPDPHTSAYLFFDRETRIETADLNITWAGAAGALVTNAADLSRFWSAFGRGKLLRGPQRKQMQTTVLAEESQEDFPGERYGLGLGWHPLTCGGGYWTHDGDVPGYSTKTGVSTDGRTTAVVSISTSADGPVHVAAWTLIDNVMCGRR